MVVGGAEEDERKEEVVDSESDPELQNLLQDYGYQSNLTLFFDRQGTAHCTISAVSAEHLKRLDSGGFKGSTFAELPGYGMPAQIELQVRNTPADAKNVENLWHQVLEAKEAREREMGKKTKKGKKSVFRPLTDG